MLAVLCCSSRPGGQRADRQAHTPEDQFGGLRSGHNDTRTTINRNNDLDPLAFQPKGPACQGSSGFSALVKLDEGLKIRRFTQHLARCSNETIDLLVAEIKIGVDAVEEIAFTVIAHLIEADVDKVKGKRVLRCRTFLYPLCRCTWRR